MSALPPVVVSGDPNMTPIFSRNWLMKITMHSLLAIAPVSLRMACDISRAWRPTTESPISPSISAFGISAATESTTMMSTAFERTSISQISSACSPVSGCETSISSRLTPMRFAQEGSSACSASMNAATPPLLCAFATTESANVVLPEDSGPKISMMRPRGRPRPPSARSRLKAPVAIDGIGASESPSSFMIEPLP